MGSRLLKIIVGYWPRDYNDVSTHIIKSFRISRGGAANLYRRPPLPNSLANQLALSARVAIERKMAMPSRPIGKSGTVIFNLGPWQSILEETRFYLRPSFATT